MLVRTPGCCGILRGPITPTATHRQTMPDDSDLPELSPRVPPGLYRHYRGGLYRVIDTVRHSETLEPLTLYQALYGQQGLWVRPAAMFL